MVAIVLMNHMDDDNPDHLDEDDPEPEEGDEVEISEPLAGSSHPLGEDGHTHPAPGRT